MRQFFFRLPVFLPILLMSFISCEKSENPPDIPDPSDTNKYILTHGDSKLVNDLNGYRFDAAFSTSEPFAYPFLWVQYIDDYNDSTRILVLLQNEFQTITQYMATNHFEGDMSRQFNHGSFPNNVSNSMSFNFNHEMFLLNSYDPINGTIAETGTVFGMNTQVAQIFTGMYDQYDYQFLNRYLIRYISGISIWPFNYPNWSDQPQFIATSELSAPKAIGHYFDESWPAFPYDVQNNMYSGYFQSTFDATYIGVAKGTSTLDTVFLNTNHPDWYDAQICKAFVDKIADTLYVGVLINVPNLIDMRASVYKMELSTNSLTEIYADVPFSYGNVIFRRGAFYGVPAQGGQYVKFNRSAMEETIPLPATSKSVRLMFSENKIFAIVMDAGSDSWVEVYSKAL